jgi:hypothetical protein
MIKVEDERARNDSMWLQCFRQMHLATRTEERNPNRKEELFCGVSRSFGRADGAAPESTCIPFRPVYGTNSKL